MHGEDTLATSSILIKVRGDVLPNLSHPSSNPLLKGHCCKWLGGLCRGWGVSFYFSSGSCTDLAVGLGKGLVTPLKKKSWFYLNTVSFQKEQHSKALRSWSDYWHHSEAFTLTQWFLTSRTIKKGHFKNFFFLNQLFFVAPLHSQSLETACKLTNVSVKHIAKTFQLVWAFLICVGKTR